MRNYQENKQMNPLEHILKFLQTKKAELVLQEQSDQFLFELNQTLTERDELETPITNTVQEKGASAYQQVTNLLNFLKELEWDDFHCELKDTRITIDRSRKGHNIEGNYQSGFELCIIDYDGKQREYVGKAYYQLGLSEDGIECESVYPKIDLIDADKKREKKEFYKKEGRFN
jgi:hypothetical protein